jgi:hypothetical protein
LALRLSLLSMAKLDKVGYGRDVGKTMHSSLMSTI